MKSIPALAAARHAGRRVALVTAYDCLQARWAARAGVDAVLVGDSVAMVVHGWPSTLHATLDMMATHVAAVRRGVPDLLVIADLPFLSTRRGRAAATDAAGLLLQAGANAVKLEGLTGHEAVVEHLVQSGIPVLGHLGLEPQAVQALGGYHVQGRDESSAARIRADAHRLAALGAFGVALECIPAALAATITEETDLLTIGIGSGPATHGQILVITDLLGMDPDFHPRHARRYLNGADLAQDALARYAADVRAGDFPAAAETLA